MADIIHWPAAVLPPQSSPFDIRPFSRTGGRSLGGLQRSVRTDRGWWVGSYQGISFRRSHFAQQRVWNAIRVALGGTTGLVAVPVCSTALWARMGLEFGTRVPHDDDTPFDDGALYAQNSAQVEMASYAPIGSSVVTLRMVGVANASGVRFSYQHAMYETGRILTQPSADTYQVEIFPAIRAPIPAGALLETDKPTVLCHLMSDAEMDLDMGPTRMPRPAVSFVEAVDYWVDLANGDIS